MICARISAAGGRGGLLRRTTAPRHKSVNAMTMHVTIYSYYTIRGTPARLYSGVNFIEEGFCGQWGDYTQ